MPLLSIARPAAFLVTALHPTSAVSLSSQGLIVFHFGKLHSVLASALTAERFGVRVLSGVSPELRIMIEAYLPGIELSEIDIVGAKNTAGNRIYS